MGRKERWRRQPGGDVLTKKLANGVLLPVDDMTELRENDAVSGRQPKNEQNSEPRPSATISWLESVFRPHAARTIPPNTTNNNNKIRSILMCRHLPTMAETHLKTTSTTSSHLKLGPVKLSDPHISFGIFGKKLVHNTEKLRFTNEKKRKIRTKLSSYRDPHNNSVKPGQTVSN